jgi:ER lumen protein retaining receptor
VILALLIKEKFDWWELTWSFSLWLEALAIFPQLAILAKYEGCETFTGHYIAALGSYRFFYILNWIYRYYTEKFLCWTSILSGVLQVLLYADFFYLYLKK